MAIVYKQKDVKQRIIEKDGTKFIFEVSESKKRQARMNTYAGMSGDRDSGALIEGVFRKSLIDWENLIDEEGKQIPFSITVRDAIVMDTDIFTDTDIFEVIGLDEPKKKAVEKASPSTSKKP